MPRAWFVASVVVCLAAVGGCADSTPASPSTTPAPPSQSTDTPAPVVFVTSVDVNPSVFESGQVVQGSLELSAPAPAEGLSVTLSSSDTAVATVDPTVTVPSGASTARFPVATRTVVTETLVTISASAGGQTRGKTIRLGPSAPVIFHDTLNAPSSRSNASLYTSYRSTFTGPYPAGGMSDDFISPKTAMIRTIRWQGGYCDRNPTPSPIQVPAAREFYLQLWRDDNGRFPNGFVWEGTFAVAQVREERVFEDGPRSACPESLSTVPSYSAYYDYTLTLGTGVPVVAGQKYWLQIWADVGPSSLRWGWRRGLQDNNFSTPNYANTYFNEDMAFQLSSAN